MPGRPRKPPEPRTANLFRNGRSQAVRLPQEFRFSGREVRIRKEGDAVVLEPLKIRGWPRGYFAKLARMRRGLDRASLERPPDPPPRPVDVVEDAP